MVALESLWMAAVVALKVVEVALAGTVTEAGRASAELVLDRLTAAPPAGEGCVRATVQTVDPLGPTLVGLHSTEETSTVAARLTVVLTELPL